MHLTISFCLVFVLIIFPNSYASPQSDAGKVDNDYKRFWFNHINQTLNLIEDAVDKEMKSNQTSQICYNHIMELVSKARKGEHWANKMIDSMGRTDSGLLELNLAFLGIYSECVQTVGPNFSGKYCLATVSLPNINSKSFNKLSDLSSDILIKTHIKVGTCVPSTCSKKHINNIANRISSALLLNSNVSISECYQQSQQNLGEDYASVFVICLFGWIIIMVIIGTIYDHIDSDNHSDSSSSDFLNRIESNQEIKSDKYKSGVNERKSMSMFCQILIAFSLKENSKKILGTKSVDNSIQVFYGIRCLSMIWIIVGHSFSFATQWMDFRNPLAIREVPQNFFSQILANGTFSVDSFLFISGFLVSFSVLKDMKREGKLHWISFYINRYLRMTPSMMAVIAFSSQLLQYLGEGPHWSESILMFSNWCQKNWWLNSLYLHNFIDTENMCLSHSWYSAVDMQLYLISPLIIIPLFRNQIKGIIIVSTFLIVSMTTISVLTIINNYPAVPYFNDLIGQDIVNQYYGSIYIKPYCRIGPYLVGIVLAYAVFTSKGNIRMKKSYSVLGWIIAFMVGLGVLFAMLPANNGNIPEVHIAAIYSATSRTIWALSLAWVTFACVTGHGGIVNRFLSWKVWIPLSRLTYCAYLVHPIVMAVFYGSRSQTFDFSIYLLTYFTISHLFITYSISFIISITIESPFISIAKLMVSNKT